MAIYYIENENGNFYSQNKRRRFFRLEGAEAQKYLCEHKGLCFMPTVTDEFEGETVFVEVPFDLKKKVVSDKNHQNYVKATMKDSGFEIVSIFQQLTGCDDLTIEDTISYPFESVENDAIHEIHLDILRCAVKTLSDEELRIIRALYLSKNPISERELSRRLGIPRKTLAYRRQCIIGKLKKYFDYSPI